MRTAWKIATVLACGWSVTGCIDGKPESDPVAPPIPAEQPGSGGMPPEPPPPPLDRDVSKEEFELRVEVDTAVFAIMSTVNVDVRSSTATEAKDLVGKGAAAYRDTRSTGPNTIHRRLVKGGGPATVRVPTIPAADTVVLWAELPPPASGADRRMLEVPLKLDKSDPAKGPVAHPIAVRLTASGWDRLY